MKVVIRTEAGEESEFHGDVAEGEPKVFLLRETPLASGKVRLSLRVFARQGEAADGRPLYVEVPRAKS